MKQLKYSVAREIFELFPSFKRGVIVCNNVHNSGEGSLDFSILLSSLKITVDNIAESKPVAAWRKAFRLMGVDPTKERVSFEGLTRRFLNNNSIRHINPVVDLGNYFSILHQCPVGAHPLTTSTTNIDLKMSAGNEAFVALGSSEIETLSQNEVVLTDGTSVLTRRFCWRQGVTSLVTQETTDLFVNFDFISDITNEAILDIIIGFNAELKRISPHAKTEFFILSIGSESRECYF